mmetsp:Transcript_61560/g.199271  ORF Transcript_61560/g.199271 Transcript_61560/m.199271 type:complete len:287 (+) Transcript_61560:1792-2652(+)
MSQACCATMPRSSSVATNCSTSSSWTLGTECERCSNCCSTVAWAPMRSSWATSMGMGGIGLVSWSSPCRPMAPEGSKPSSSICAHEQGARHWKAVSTARPCGSCIWVAATTRCCRCSAVACGCPSGATPQPPARRPRTSSGRMCNASSRSMSETWTATPWRLQLGGSRGASLRRGCSMRSASGGSQRPPLTSSTASGCCLWMAPRSRRARARTGRRRPPRRRWRASSRGSTRGLWQTTYRSCDTRHRRVQWPVLPCSLACGSCRRSWRYTRTDWCWIRRPPPRSPP